MLAPSSTSAAALTVATESGEETSDGLDWPDTSRPPFVDSEAVPQSKQGLL